MVKCPNRPFGSFPLTLHRLCLDRYDAGQVAGSDAVATERKRSRAATATAADYAQAEPLQATGDYAEADELRRGTA